MPKKLFDDGKELLQKIISDKQLTAKAVIGFYPAHAEDETVYLEQAEFHFPRQLVDKGKNKPNYCLADFIAPQNDWLGMFAVTAGHGLQNLVSEFEEQNDDYNAILAKVLADRLAEALTEKMHQRVRIEFWGYAADEGLDNEGLIKEEYRGIRPAPGYAACPEHKVKDTIWKLLNVQENTGITLTETRAMYPAASVSGWYFSHPESRYFSTGKSQLEQ